ncbi:diacylglycerol kinase eta [Hermetia illucens]|uniref:diacylglycerol kinase eta n=1 Tax=Hermetia illucens TaxID=343691 RepID=UPI0018CC5D96|nr:diacylglycerol kinase eta [Hermetia illucens]
MEDWLNALKTASAPEYYESGLDQHDFLSNHHHWYATSHARPTYCNVCREALSGVTSHGLSCEVCKCKVHKRCAAKAIANCKWTTLATVGKDIIEEKDGSIVMPHQWMEGNLPVASTCSVCKKTCGSVLRLQDWRCLWCRAAVHTACRPQMTVACPLGPAKLSVVPPTSVHCIGMDEAWDVVKPQGNFSPLLVFVNSKSGDNQGVKFLRRFKQLLNPAQVFDLISTGPSLGLRLFHHFDPFRILVCSGDGSVGWVLSEIDRFDMHKQCQVAVLPLGTGNDLARVLGWGSSCDDDAHLPQILERYETASTKMLDRWSIMVFEKAIPVKDPKMSITNAQEIIMTNFVESANWHLKSIVETDDFQVVVSSTKILCETIDELLVKISENRKDDEQLNLKCDILRQKLGMLLDALKDEEAGEYRGDDLFQLLRDIIKQSSLSAVTASLSPSSVATPTNDGSILKKTEKDELNTKERRNSRILRSKEREALQSRANSVKRAIYNIIEHSEPGRPKRYQRKLSLTPFEALKIPISSTDTSPCSSPLPIPPINIISPSVSTTRLTCISPLPDLRRDSTDETYLSTINLPVPKQFADGGASRRSSGVPESIQEIEENGAHLETATGALTPPKENEPTTSSATPTMIESKRAIDSADFLAVPIYPFQQHGESLNEFRPMEVYERDLLRQLAAKKLTEMKYSEEPKESSSQVPKIVTPKQDRKSNVYTSESMTIIDTDPVEQSSSDEAHGEPSDILSAISNEECSVTSEILDKPSESYPQFHVADIIQDLTSDRLTHIDSPETSDTTEAMPGESLMDDISSVLGNDLLGALQDSTITDDTFTLCSDNNTVSQNRKSIKRRSIASAFQRSDSFDDNSQFGFENIVFEIDNRCDDQKAKEPIRYCSLAQFVEGNDIARKSFKRTTRSKSITKTTTISTSTQQELTEQKTTEIKIEIEEPSQTCPETPSSIKGSRPRNEHLSDGKRISFDVSCKKESFDDEARRPNVSVVVEPPSPLRGDELRVQRINEIRRHSSHSPSLTVREYEKEKDRRHSGYNPNLLGLDPEHVKFLSNSPAASRRISCGSLFKPNEAITLTGSKSSLFMGSSFFSFDSDQKEEKLSKSERAEQKNKKLPIINPLVRLPAWPNVSAGAGFISKCLLANADTLCAAVSPLMDPDETLLEGYHEKCVMNNYFGIGIDAKISLDFHNKREEHPEKCRSRAKNYMWYGVLGSKQLLQKTYKNLEQRVQLECDGQRIPLPSLQGIVVLNIPSFMGGTNFWGGTKEDDCFLAQSFDDRILEVVAVFGSVQMAASRLINLQHHRIAQCQSVQINILGDEEVPIQVDGEAWLQPPGMIRIIHKNRVQMLCRNRNLEVALKSWQEKQRQHSISIQREQTSTISESITLGSEDMFSERETYVLLVFIECVSSLVKWVKFLIISHPSLEADLYAVACRAQDALEATHPNGKIIEGPNLRIKLAELESAARQLYEESYTLLRDRGHSLILREDLEAKLSTALANMEMELRKTIVQKGSDGQTRVFFNVLAPLEEPDTRKKTRPFWARLRSGSTAPGTAACKLPSTNSRDAVSNWGVNEVVTWLETMQLSEYVETFVANDIRGKELLTLGRRDLKELGVVKVGHVKRILQAIKDLGGT